MKELIKRYRCLSHKRYVKHVMAELSSEILKDAINNGLVDLEKRNKLLRYKEYYNKL